MAAQSNVVPSLKPSDAMDSGISANLKGRILSGPETYFRLERTNRCVLRRNTSQPMKLTRQDASNQSIDALRLPALGNATPTRVFLSAITVLNPYSH